jgi:hypothetical protein
MIQSEQIKIKIKDIEKQIQIATNLIVTIETETKEGKQSNEYWNDELSKLKFRLSELLKELISALEQEANEQKENK